MKDTLLLIGSLSNDLLRFASLTQKGSPAAARFLAECQRWIVPLSSRTDLPPHLTTIIRDISTNQGLYDMATAERYLMYSTLLQNYALHSQSRN